MINKTLITQGTFNGLLCVYGLLSISILFVFWFQNTERIFKKYRSHGSKPINIQI